MSAGRFLDPSTSDEGSRPRQWKGSGRDSSVCIYFCLWCLEDAGTTNAVRAFQTPSTVYRLLNHNLTILFTLRPIQPSNCVSSLSALVLLKASTEFKEPCRWINHWQRPFLGVWIWSAFPLHRCLIFQRLGMFWIFLLEFLPWYIGFIGWAHSPGAMKTTTHVVWSILGWRIYLSSCVHSNALKGTWDPTRSCEGALALLDSSSILWITFFPIRSYLWKC